MEGYRVEHILVAWLAMLQLSNHIVIVSCTGAAGTDYIKASCGSTRYPDLCYETLQKYAPEIKSSRRTLALTSLTVTLGLIKQSKVSLTRLTQSKTSSSMENQVMGDCLKQLKSAQGHLEDSKFEFQSITDPANSRLKVSNVQTWVSAAMTNQNTCTDGFDDQNLTGQVESDTAANVRKVERMTSISLHFFNNYAGRN